MKVAIASRNLRGQTGASEIVLKHVRRLVAAGDEVDLIGERLNHRLISQAGARPISRVKLPFFRYAAREHFAKGFDEQTRKAGYDLIIGNGELLHQDVLFIHNLPDREHDVLKTDVRQALLAEIQFQRRMLTTGSFKVCIANSFLTKDHLVQRYQIDPEKIEVVYPAYDPDKFSTRQSKEIRSRERPQICDLESFLIGFITSGHFRKRGADLMVDTLQLLPDKMRNSLRILAVGSKNNLKSLAEMFAKCGLEEQLIMRSKTDDIARYYHAIDLLFYPARIEEFGLVVLEAAACGTPILSSRAVGAAELLPPCEISIISKPEPGKFADCLNVLINDPGILQKIAEQQHEAVADHSWAAYFDNIEKIYRERGLI